MTTGQAPNEPPTTVSLPEWIDDLPRGSTTAIERDLLHALAADAVDGVVLVDVLAVADRSGLRIQTVSTMLAALCARKTRRDRFRRPPLLEPFGGDRFRFRVEVGRNGIWR